MSAVVPIGALDYRLPQAGRIRTGAKVKARNGKMIPRALDHFRFTSGDRDLVAWVAERYGGTVQSFNEPGSGDKWVVDTPATTIEVILAVPKGFTLSYEMWDPHLVRRCNGSTCDVLEETEDGADFRQRDCLCARLGRLECDKKLRLSVLLPGINTLGTWRYDTESENAIKEIRGVFKFLHDWAGAGLHPAKMRLEQRRAPTERGKPGKVFTVVVLDTGTNIESLLAGESRLVQLPSPHQAAGELGAGASSVTLTSTPEAGEPMAGEAGEATHLPSGPSPASPPKPAGPSPRSYEVLCTQCGEPMYDGEPGDDRHDVCPIVDAELVDDEMARDVNHYELVAWLEGLAASQRNRLLPQARKLAIDMGEPVPTTFDQITDPVLERLKAGDDEHSRVRTDG